MNSAPSRPVLRWHHGKWLLAPWIIDHFPAHRVYVEPFLRTLKGMVVLSGCPAPLYVDALAGWLRVERRALADGARERTEVLWINQACAARLGTVAHQLDMLEAAE